MNEVASGLTLSWAALSGLTALMCFFGGVALWAGRSARRLDEHEARLDRGEAHFSRLMGQIENLTSALWSHQGTVTEKLGEIKVEVQAELRRHLTECRAMRKDDGQ